MIGDGNSMSFWHDRWMGEFTLASLFGPDHPQVNEARVSEFTLDSGQWNVDSLCKVLPKQLVNQVTAIPLPSTQHMPDLLIWESSHAGNITAKERFRWSQWWFDKQCLEMDLATFPPSKDLFCHLAGSVGKIFVQQSKPKAWLQAIQCLRLVSKAVRNNSPPSS